MILNHVNHKMPIYKDCTLGEMMVVGFMTFSSMSLFLSFLTWFLFGYAWIGFAISLLSLLHTTRFLLGRLQKMKYGKPHGYYQQKILKNIHQNAFFSFLQPIIKLPYLQREGKWSVRRV